MLRIKSQFHFGSATGSLASFGEAALSSLLCASFFGVEADLPSDLEAFALGALFGSISVRAIRVIDYYKFAKLLEAQMMHRKELEASLSAVGFEAATRSRVVLTYVTGFQDKVNVTKRTHDT